MIHVFTTFGRQGFGNYEVDWEAVNPVGERVERPARGLLIPGFVDIHFHGAFGIDFMSASTADMNLLCEKLATLGYETVLPTTVTASAADVTTALSHLPNHRMIGGFHLEGPFISPKHPGAQPPSAIVDPPNGPSEWDEIFDDPRLRVITLAPERPGALELSMRLMTRGVRVSMGHTDATYEEARRGFEFGAAHTTHTFNAMRPFHHREAGVVGYALQSESLFTELIYDRHHVSPEAAALLIKCKSHDRLIAVSDSTMATGMPGGVEIEMWGLKCVTGRGEVRLADSGALAGSAITLLDAFRNIATDFGEELAVRACCINPRATLGMTWAPRVYLELNHDYEIVGRREFIPDED